MTWIATPEAWIALLTLTVLEIVLGIDNVVFISILAGRLPPEQRSTARVLGLALAMLTRIALLFSVKWLSTLTSPLFALFGFEVAGRNLVFLGGALFLLAKSTQEIHQRLEGDEERASDRAAPSLASVIAQIALLDIVFSLDSVITAVGMADHLAVMVIAVVLAVLVMMWASGPISAFVDRHPTVKMLALSFLLLIGMTLLAEAFDQHIPKGYIYVAMGFSIFVEMLNLRAARARREPVVLRQRLREDGDAARGDA